MHICIQYSHVITPSHDYLLPPARPGAATPLAGLLATRTPRAVLASRLTPEALPALRRDDPDPEVAEEWRAALTGEGA